MHTRPQLRQRRRQANLAAVLLLGACLASSAAALGLTVWFNQQTAIARLGPVGGDLNAVEAGGLGLYLAAHWSDLQAPAGADNTPVTFTVAPGETAGQVTENLAAAHLVADAQLLNLYLRYRGFDNAIEAGDFILRQTLAPTEIAVALTDARAREFTVRIIEGWRLEQIAASLSADPRLAVSAADFLTLAGPGGIASQLPVGGAIPPGASLEGFLFPDTYIVQPGATARDLLDKMTANFEAQLPADFDARIQEHALNRYQAVIIASLIEREAVQDDERPLIASVILNRLVIGQPLEIDATVQYAVATPDNWWPAVGALDFRSIDSPYNTYFVTGLPAGPIANPGAASLRAVAQPAHTGYLYYRALCDGSGRHAFAMTYEQHLANACP